MTDKAHAVLGASNAARWVACPGSVRLTRDLPNPGNEHSRLGTAAHTVAEKCLRRGTDPATYIGMALEVDGEEIIIDEETTEAVRVYVNFCRERMAVADKYGFEQKVSLESLAPPDPMFGTVDFWALAGTTLDIADYKNGSGVVVEVRNNFQLRYYALGLVLELGLTPELIRITVVQPRASHSEGVVRTEELSYIDLLDFAGELMDAARATQDPNAPLVAGRHCRFCPASSTCPAQYAQAQAIAQVEFGAMPLDVPPPPSILSPEMLGDIMSKLPILDAWMAAVRADAMARLERGESVPGFKAVPKRATRKWVSEEQVVHWLKQKGFDAEEIHTLKVKSPSQVETLLGKQKKELPQEFYEKVSSGYTLAPDHDARPAVQLGPVNEFAALPAGDAPPSQAE